MQKPFLLFLVLVLGLVTPTKAQDSLGYTLRGIVIDQVNHRGLPDAQVHVTDSHVATMTNADGRFALKVRALPASLTISMLGYGNAEVTREQLQKAQPTEAGDKVKEIRIALEPTPKYLKEVYVYSPRNILEAAIEKIGDNFPNESQRYETFYRETIRKRSSYVSVSEAVMQIYKTPYKDDQTWHDMVHLLKGRSLMSQRAKDTISVRVQGGPTEALHLDLVKNRSTFLCPEMLDKYLLEFEAPQAIDNRSQCVIAFRPRVDDEEPLFSGRIYIDYQTLTFTRIEYNINMKYPDKVTRLILAKKPFGMRFTPRALEFVMNYYYDGHRSYLSYLKTTYRFDCDWKKRGIRTPYEAVSEMLITGFTSPAERPAHRGAFKNYQLLSSEVKDFDDPDFWKDYNILMPSESLEHAMKKLKKRGGSAPQPR